MKARFLIILIGLAILILLTTVFVIDRSRRVAPTLPTSSPSSQNSFSREWSKGNCEGQGPVQFTEAIADPKEIEAIWPLGLMANDHVTPVDHQYYIFQNTSKDHLIHAPAKGNIVRVEYSSGRHKGYRVDIEFTCTFYLFVNPESLSDDVARQISFDGTDHQVLSTRIPVAAGQVLGTGPGLDIWLINTQKQLPGFVVPSHYESEPWKIYAASHLDYFVEPIKSQLLAIDLRLAEPRGGKIDYDVDGRLVGNWFKLGSVDSPEAYRQSGLYRNDLVFAYDFIDPTAIRISVGDYNGASKQFGVKGNGPDPKDVSVESGLIKYELTSFEWVNQQTGVAQGNWDLLLPGPEYRIRNIENAAQGVLLVQLMEERKLKIEIFPGKTASQVTSFTYKALIYER